MIGTSPTGYVILFDYNGTSGRWSPTIISNLKSVYGVSTPVKVWGVSIGDANNQGDNKIVVGTWYQSGGADTGQLHMFYKQGTSWVRTNIANPVPGGVYSVAIGDADGQGATRLS